MQIDIKSFILELIRVILFVAGIATFVLSFFHGSSINIGTFLGVSLLAASVTIFVTVQQKSMKWVFMNSLVCFGLYMYFLKLLIINQELDYELGNIDVTTIILYLLPLLSLLYLIFHFVMMLVKSKTT